MTHSKKSQNNNEEDRRNQWGESYLIGQIAVFKHPEHNWMCGQIVAQKYTGRTKRGNIPNFLIRARGRTGKIIEVDLVEQYTQTFDTWVKAIKNINLCNNEK